MKWFQRSDESKARSESSPNAEVSPAVASGEVAFNEATDSPSHSTSGGEKPVYTPVLEAKVIEAISSCYDPEIPVNIYDLGLVYDIDVRPNGEVFITMTLTSPFCPVAESLPLEVESKVSRIEGVTNVEVDVVWEPRWTPEFMTEAARLELGLM
ncbi:MAG: DUF59 domain-containing protein [Armatimonadetes bacterium]|nr:DUF59 domain-containing protein [Armatimonadota bacterium]